MKKDILFYNLLLMNTLHFIFFGVISSNSLLKNKNIQVIANFICFFSNKKGENVTFVKKTN